MMARGCLARLPPYAFRLFIHRRPSVPAPDTRREANLNTKKTNMQHATQCRPSEATR
jgi:hypothetical protein